MALSSTSVKYILIGAALVLLGFFIVSLVWEGLKLALGVLIGGALIWLGIRFLMGKGLPKGVENVAKKVVDAGKAATAEKDDSK